MKIKLPLSKRFRKLRKVEMNVLRISKTVKRVTVRQRFKMPKRRPLKLKPKLRKLKRRLKKLRRKSKRSLRK